MTLEAVDSGSLDAGRSGLAADARLVQAQPERRSSVMG